MLTRIMSQFSVNFFSLAVPKNFVGEHFCVSKKFWCQIFSVEAFMSRSTKRLRWGTLLSFTKFLVSESITNKMGGTEVVSRLFIKTFCSTAPKNFVRESFSLLLISGIKTIMPMRVMSCFSVELL